MENILSYYVVTNGVAKDLRSLDRILDKGQLITNGGFFSKPKDGFYIIASTQTYLKFIDAFKPGFNPGPVSNNFTQSITRLTQILTPQAVIDLNEKGIVEATSDSSLLGFFIDNYDFSGSEGAQTLFRIIDKGVIMCYSESTDSLLLASPGTFLKWAEATNYELLPSPILYNWYGSDPADGGVPA